MEVAPVGLEPGTLFLEVECANHWMKQQQSKGYLTMQYNSQI